MNFKTQVAYWDRGIENVPQMTGASGLLDGGDLVEWAPRLGLTLPLVDVLDIGCGTGRIAQHCRGYLGMDIAPSAVAYCRKQGLDAMQITSPSDIPERGWNLVLCLSVFTHIDRAGRQAYLAAFAKVTHDVVIDIIPGDGKGDIRAWTSRPEHMLADLQGAGFTEVVETDWAWNGYAHRYYRGTTAERLEWVPSDNWNVASRPLTLVERLRSESGGRPKKLSGFENYVGYDATGQGFFQHRRLA